MGTLVSVSYADNLQAPCCGLPAKKKHQNKTPGLSRFSSLLPYGDGLPVTYVHDLCSKESISADIDQHIAAFWKMKPTTHVACKLVAQGQS